MQAVETIARGLMASAHPSWEDSREQTSEKKCDEYLRLGLQARIAFRGERRMKFNPDLGAPEPKVAESRVAAWKPAFIDNKPNPSQASMNSVPDGQTMAEAHQMGGPCITKAIRHIATLVAANRNAELELQDEPENDEPPRVLPEVKKIQFTRPPLQQLDLQPSSLWLRRQNSKVEEDLIESKPSLCTSPIMRLDMKVKSVVFALHFPSFVTAV